MKRFLILAACGGGGDPGSPIDAGRIPQPTVDAPAAPALLTARVYSTAMHTAPVHEVVDVEVDVTNLGGTVISDLQWSDSTGATVTGCDQGFLPAGEMCRLDFLVRIGGVDPLTDHIRLMSQVGGEVTLDVPISGVAAPSFDASPSALALYQVPLVGPGSTGRDGVITLRNNTAAPLGPIAYSIAGDPAFTLIEYDGCVGTNLLPGTTCRIAVEHAPTTTGTAHATATITAGSEQATVAVSGTGTPLLIADGFSDDHVVVPDAYVGTSGGARHIKVTNMLADPTGPLAVSITHADGTLANEFQMFEQNCVGTNLPSLITCDLFIGLASGDAGMKSATLKVSSGTMTGSMALVGYVVSRN